MNANVVPIILGALYTIKTGILKPAKYFFFTAAITQWEISDLKCLKTHAHTK